MQWAGFQGSFGSGTSTVSVSADDEEWYTFLVELHKVFGTYPFPFTVKDTKTGWPSCVPVRAACVLGSDVVKETPRKNSGLRVRLSARCTACPEFSSSAHCPGLDVL